MSDIRFGVVLKKRRENKGWTQEQLASRAELSTRHVQSLEATDKLPSIETIFKLALALNTSPGLLVEPLWHLWKEENNK